MTSPDAAPAASTIAALLRRALIALGVAAAFVVLGMLFSGDRASAAEPDESPRPVTGLLAPVESLLDDSLLDDALLGNTVDDTLEVVEAVVAPVEQLAAPVLDTVGTVLPAEVAVPSTPVADLVAAPLAEVAPLAPPAHGSPAPSSVETSDTASADPVGTPRGTPGSPPTDAVLTASAPGGAAAAGVSPTAASSAPTLADSIRPPIDEAPPAPVVDSDSTPD